MSKRMPKEVSVEDLTRLPLRAIVAFAARCAWRARPLYDADEGTTLDQAIQVAEVFARGANHAQGLELELSAYLVAKTTPSPLRFVVWAAGHAARAANRAVDPGRYDSQEVGLHAYQTATMSREVLSPSNVKSGRYASMRHLQAERADYQALVGLQLGQFPDLGQPVDPSEIGPLGALWPEG